MKVSIVSAYYQLEDMTKDFLDNLEGKLPEGTELILVNAGSKKIEHPIVTKRVDLPENKSFSNSMNAGIKEATGDYVCVIGNDVFPDDGWLEKLLEIAEDTKSFVVSPVNDKTELSNYMVNEIREGLYQAQFFPAVCWLLSRECIDKVGLFDQQFLLGTWEDNDYARRVYNAGGSILVTTDVMVKHLESQTLQLLGDVSQILNNNSKVYYEKYNNGML